MKSKPGTYRAGHGGYVSEFEQFMNTFLERHPEIEKDKIRGWYIWWDHNVDLDQLEQQRKDSVSVKPYQYE